MYNIEEESVFTKQRGVSNESQKYTKERKANITLKIMKKHIMLFDWKDVEQAFSWSETGKMNMAYECIDRHVDQGSGDKIALNYKDEHRKNRILIKRYATVI